MVIINIIGAINIASFFVEIFMIIKTIMKNDDEYSYYLRNINDPPEKLYCLGNTELLRERCISIVGTRKSTPKGDYIAKTISQNLSKQGYVIVSGLAMGIDRQAHLGAIKNNCRTICVLGSGFKNLYPKENYELFNYIITNGGLAISEYGPNEKATPDKFPMRNRIISGLSESIIVVEAGLKSGSLITAELGMEQGRSIYAIPGDIFSKNHKGTNWLILNGATPLISIEKNIYL